MKVFRHVPCAQQHKYHKDNNKPEFKDWSTVSDRTNAMLGNEKDNRKAYLRILDYQNATLMRITTKIHNFQVHRIIITERGTPPNTTITEDKITFTDPIVYFYRDTTGNGYPPSITDNSGDWTEVAKRKCIRGCKDGWYWSTNFNTKTQRVMVPAKRVADAMLTGATRNANPGLKELLTRFGVQRKTYDIDNDAPTRGVHSQGYIIGRGAQYTPQWFGGGLTSAEKVARTVTDYITFDQSVWWTFKLFTRLD